MMTWLLMWLNVSVATLNATLQLLVIYRFVCLEIDSTLVIHLLTSQSNPTVGMSMVAFYCKNLLRRQWNLKLQHIYHEANGVAYLLAKRGKTKWKE